MHHEEYERDPFDAFGDVETGAEYADDADLAAETQPEPAAAPRPAFKPGFSWAGFLGGLAALLWIAGAITIAISYYGSNALLTLDPAVQAGLLALAFGPALLFWVAASAAGEALKARKLAAELAQLALSSRTPFEAGEADARRMGQAVRTEIDALTEAVAVALDRMAEMEGSAKRHANILNEAAAVSREDTQTMTDALERERNALAAVTGDLRDHTEAVASSISRQVRLMRETSKLVKSEFSVVEDALQAHLASFAAAASVISERTGAFHGAAEEASAATATLNSTMMRMLDGLTEATRLSDAARKCSEQAVEAAAETAGALRETTRSAVFEAQRAAQMIRAETTAMQEAAAETLAKLREAAGAAQVVSKQAEPAAAPQRATRQPAVRDRTSANPREKADAQIASLEAAAKAALARTAPPARPQEPQRQSFKGFGSWGNFAPRAQDKRPAPANDELDFINLDDRDPDASLKTEALDLVTDAGVDLDDVLRASDLERIARHSRDGASARRRAVEDAAPGAITRIARYLNRNEKAHLVANEFRARPDLAKSEHKGESGDLVRAYLLIDAALA